MTKSNKKLLSKECVTDTPAYNLPGKWNEVSGKDSGDTAVLIGEILHANHNSENKKPLSPDGSELIRTLDELDEIFQENLIKLSKQRAKSPNLRHDSLVMCLNEAKCSPLLTAGEEKSLVRQAKEGNERALKRMMESNILLVAKYAFKLQGHGLMVTDLIQEGSFGLKKAIEQFDPEKGFKFSTYATPKIKKEMQVAISDQSRTVRRPVHVYELASKVKHAAKKIEADGKIATPELIKETLGVRQSQLSIMYEAMAQTQFSVNIPIGEDGVSEYLDIMPDDDATDTALKAVNNESLGNFINEALLSDFSPLNKKEKKILILQYGLNGEKEHSPQQIADIFGHSYNHINKTQNDIRIKIREYMAQNNHTQESLCMD